MLKLRSLYICYLCGGQQIAPDDEPKMRYNSALKLKRTHINCRFTMP